MDSGSAMENMTFEQAIARAQDLLAQASPDQTQLKSTITDLVASDNGARGFFVTFLTGENSLADQPTEAVLDGLRSAPERVADLLTRNLAMSTGMALTHQRQGHPDQAAGSERVQRRTLLLMQKLQLPVVETKLAELAQSLAGEGPFSSFLDRWGYDAEQRNAIRAALPAVV
jgi:hypothetical protein